MAKDSTKFVRPDSGTEFQTEYTLASERTLHEMMRKLQTLFTKIDSISGVQAMIDIPHSKIHDGEAFVCHYSQTVSDTNDQSIIAFKTGNTRILHPTVSASCSTAAVAYILEAPTITNNAGASLTVFNRRRVGTPKKPDIIDTSTNPDTTGQAMFFTEITMGNVTGGNTIASIPIIAGAGPKAIGGIARDTQEWNLKPDTFYAFVLNSSSDLDNVMWLEVDWYETAED